jgi:hypothetical protein
MPFSAGNEVRGGGKKKQDDETEKTKKVSLFFCLPKNELY